MSGAALRARAALDSEGAGMKAAGELLGIPNLKTSDREQISLNF
jgi:hypothetical protein